MYVIRGNTYSVKEELKKEKDIGLQWDKENKVWCCLETFPLDKPCYKKANISFEDVGDEITPVYSARDGLKQVIESYRGKDMVSASSVVEHLEWVLNECDWYRR